MSSLILLVEDNPDDQLLIARSLGHNGVRNELKIVSDGASALEYLLAPEAPLPAVVLLDLKLPRVDGIEVLKRIRGNARTALLPVVILTSSNEESDLLASYKNGCNSFVRKPIDFAEFSRAVAQIGLYWLLVNEQPPHA